MPDVSKGILICLGLIAAALATIFLLAMKGADDSNRAWQLARFSAEMTCERIQDFRTDAGRYPHDLSELVSGGHPGRGPYSMPERLIDSWHRPYYYRASSTGFVLFTLGEDGRIGGQGNSADFGCSEPQES
jgi:type II secretory pathway pseudopilin PulG